MPLPTPDIGKLQLSGIGQILAEGKLRIPPYQRAYAWKTQHVRAFLGDLSKAIGTDEPQYFLGIVAIAERDEFRRDVIAGQHRLVTSTILIAAIRDFFYSRHDQERYEAICGFRKIWPLRSGKYGHLDGGPLAIRSALRAGV